MAYAERKTAIERVEALRGRRLICFFNFDRASHPQVPGLSVNFDPDSKEALFRVLKESPAEDGLDLCLYTRGGDTNAVWPLVSLLREFDPDFEILAPFRCHSSGTLVAIGAKRIVMGPISELSPIDASTANQFNPVGPGDENSRLGISVEDVRAFRSWVEEQFDAKTGDLENDLYRPFVERLAIEVHPLALGNVKRVMMQIEQLATNLLKLHPVDNMDYDEVVKDLASRFYSHLHMINRHEAKEILADKIVFAPDELASALDELMYLYENDFRLRSTFVLASHLGTDSEAECRFIGGAIESTAWSYLFETKVQIRQYSKIPGNVQIQVPLGQPVPIVSGLPRETAVDLLERGWVRNTQPIGVTI